MFFDSILLNDCFQLHLKAPIKEIVCDAILSLNLLLFSSAFLSVFHFYANYIFVS